MKICANLVSNQRTVQKHQWISNFLDHLRDRKMNIIGNVDRNNIFGMLFRYTYETIKCIHIFLLSNFGSKNLS